MAFLLFASCTRDNFGAFSFDGGDDAAGTQADAGDDGGAGDLAMACADVFGKYGMITAVGNCNDLNVAAPQCVAGTTLACMAHFVSAPSGATGAVNGGAQLAGSSFSGAQLFLGTQKRTCSGTFDSLTGVLTITCGSGGELCTVTMTKQGACG